MRIERERSTVLRATLHAHELAALMTAARYVALTSPDDVPEGARRRLAALLEDYDEQVRRLPSPTGQGPDPERGPPPGGGP
ncbi:hypothetical protein [Streptomonospora litoralis]|uniref:Uncharacterized protein n=1 Tax=Streptomonospora litoralis TaxID=2498135 RepID=A0A4P6Q7D9_9ACTN|nr:hypothetical protein [Streptomonospora litoralis]QBI54864.1 hypothetical protein EKD16_15450 [Streptomonospora litoralis]